MKEAELHPAYQWDCDCCGKENFSRQATVGENELIIPTKIACWNCESVFRAIVPEEPEDEEDEAAWGEDYVP